MRNKKLNENVTFHFDTTSRNCIDGEWPAFILNFSEGHRYNLRPVYVAYEDQENTAKVIVETYERLAIAAEVKLLKPVYNRHYNRTSNSPAGPEGKDGNNDVSMVIIQHYVCWPESTQGSQSKL